jgi:hypothetical protein
MGDSYGDYHIDWAKGHADSQQGKLPAPGSETSPGYQDGHNYGGGPKY